MSALSHLRIANEIRQEEWDPAGGAKDWAWRTNELAGEAGEVCNILKKLHRERMGIPGSRATSAMLAEELADVVICVDLCAMHQGIGPFTYSVRKQVKLDVLCDRPIDAGNLLVARVGAVCATAIKTPRRNSRSVSLQYIEVRLRMVMQVVRGIAVTEKIDLGLSVPAKFNATSEKIGLATCMPEGEGA